MRKLVLLAQTSLDGFVAGPKGEFDHFIAGEENLAHVCSIIDSADAALFGRVSYQFLQSFWPQAAANPGATANEIKYSNWYNAVPKYVLSGSLTTDNTSNARFFAANIEAEINAVKQQPGKDILIFGSPSAAHTLFDLGLIDNIWLIVHPVIFGSGIPLFRNRPETAKLDLQISERLSNGTLCNKYAVL